MAKIVIADSDFVVSDIEQKMIEDAGIEFARFQDKSAAGIIKNCADAEGIITAYGEFPREVFAAPLRRGAANVILVHNHPSGSSRPSQDDIDLTQRLSWAGDIMGIHVLDHIIIGDGEYTSMKRERLF